MRMALERGGHAVAGHPVRRCRIQRRIRGVDGHQPPVPGVRAVLGIARRIRVQAARGAELQRIGVDDGGTRAVADEGAQQLAETGHGEEQAAALRDIGDIHPRVGGAAAIAGLDP